VKFFIEIENGQGVNEVFLVKYRDRAFIVSDRPARPAGEQTDLLRSSDAPDSTRMSSAGAGDSEPRSFAQAPMRPFAPTGAAAP
jgi:hypothetical protein